MAFKRIATLDIKQVYATDENGKFQWRSFVKQANDNPSQDRTDFLPKDAYKYDTDHFLFLTARAISGMEKWGHNGNYDAFPWEEIKKALPTYPGCGFYIEHKEDSEEDAKGIVLDAFANDEEEYAVCLCAIDKDEYPEFCQQILDGTYNQVSMSCLANECECSECGNVAHSFDELCQHMNPNMPITYMKGKTNDKGEDIYEINRDLCFSGLSAVAVPADKDAFVFDIKAAKKKENKLKEELVKYQNIKQAAKMKEFRTACEEEFKALDTVALLNKLQNCATAITNQVVDQQTGTEVINGPLQGILKQLMELQIGLTILDLNKLAAPAVDNTVAIKDKSKIEMPEITTNVQEEVKPIQSKLTNKRKQELKDKFEEYMNLAAYEEDLLPETATMEELLSWVYDHAADSDKIYFWKNLGLTKEEVDELGIWIEPEDEVNLDKEIDSYLDGDNWSYTPFNSTATKKQAGIYFLKNNKELQDFLNLHGEEINDIKIKNDGNGYRVYFENEYGKFHDDVYVTKTFSSLDKIIKDTYK